MQGKNFDIFISYRRSDGDEIAAKINETLKGNHYRCFFDFESLKDGRFDDRIERAIEDAPVFIALLTPHYLERPKKDAEKELSEEEKGEQEKDWVIREIECAIKNKRKIIPIDYNKKFVDYPESISEEIKKGLGDHNFAVVSSGQQYPRDMKALMEEWIGDTIPKPTEKTQGKANIEVKSDANCDILKAGEVIATVAKGGYNILKLSEGTHRLVFRSNEFSDIEQEVIKEVKSNLADDIIDVNLAGKVEERRREEEAKTNEKLKREKEIEAQKKLEELLKEQQKKEAEERRREAERRERERRQREEEARRRREERERRKEEFKAWWKKNQSKVWGILAAVAFIWIVIIAVDSCEGTTETATETAVETKTETQTETPIVANEDKFNEYKDSIRKAEEKRQAEIERQKAQQEKKRQAEEKKKQDEAKFNEYKEKGDDYFDMFLANPDDNNYKYQARYYYGLALKYKEDAMIRNLFENLKK